MQRAGQGRAPSPLQRGPTGPSRGTVALAGFLRWSPEKLLVSWDVVVTYLPIVSLLSGNVKACVIL